MACSCTSHTFRIEAHYTHLNPLDFAVRVYGPPGGGGPTGNWRYPLLEPLIVSQIEGLYGSVFPMRGPTDMRNKLGIALRRVMGLSAVDPSVFVGVSSDAWIIDLGLATNNTLLDIHLGPTFQAIFGMYLDLWDATEQLGFKRGAYFDQLYYVHRYYEFCIPPLEREEGQINSHMSDKVESGFIVGHAFSYEGRRKLSFVGITDLEPLVNYDNSPDVHEGTISGTVDYLNTQNFFRILKLFYDGVPIRIYRDFEYDDPVKEYQKWTDLTRLGYSDIIIERPSSFSYDLATDALALGYYSYDIKGVEIDAV